MKNALDGKVLYDEKDLEKMNLDKYRNTDIGIVFQSYNLLPRLTAIENIILSMDVSKAKIKDKKKKALELMKSVGLYEEHSKRKILKLLLLVVKRLQKNQVLPQALQQKRVLR